MVNVNHKVYIYLEYHSVCPLVGIGNPPPPPHLPLVSLSPPPPGAKGGTHSPVGEGVGDPNSDD